MRLNLHTHVCTHTLAHIHTQSHKPQSLPSLVTQAQCSILCNKWLHISNVGAHSSYLASRHKGTIIRLRFFTYYKSSDSFIHRFNIYDEDLPHALMWLPSPSAPCLMTELLNQGSKNDCREKCFACNYMDAPFYDRRMGLAVWQRSLVAAGRPLVGHAQWVHSHLHMHLLLKCLLCSRAFSLSVALSGMTLWTGSGCKGLLGPLA